jgi:hypothetical protein
VYKLPLVYSRILVYRGPLLYGYSLVYSRPEHVVASAFGPKSLCRNDLEICTRVDNRYNGSV